MKQLGQSIRFTCFYYAGKVGKPGLTVVVDVYKNGTLDRTVAATDGGGGLYSYTMAGAGVDVAGIYVAIFRTTDDSVNLQHLPSAYSVGENWVQFLNASILDLPFAVWNVLKTYAFTPGSLGAKLAALVLGADNKMVLSSDPHTGAVIPTVNSVTDARMAFLDAAVSTAGTLAANAILVTPANKIGTNASNQMFVGAFSASAIQSMWEISESTVFAPGSLAAKLKRWTLGTDNKALISSDAHTSGATVANITDKTGFALSEASSDSVAVKTESRIYNENDGTQIIEAIKAKIAAINPSFGDLTLGQISDSVATKIERAGGIVWAIKAKTDNLPALPSAQSDIPTAAQNANAVWNYSAGERTLSNFGTLVQQVAASVWTYSGGERALTAFNFTVATAANGVENAIKLIVDKFSFTNGKVDANATVSSASIKSATSEALDEYDVAKSTDVDITVTPPVVPAPIVNVEAPIVNVAAPIVNPTPVTVQGGFTDEYKQKVNAIQEHSARLDGLIETTPTGDRFKASALEEAPGATGALTPDQDEALFYIEGKFREQPAPFVVLAPEVLSQDGIPRVRVSIYGVRFIDLPPNAKFTFRPKETRPVVFDGRIACPEEITVRLDDDDKADVILFPSSQFTKGGFDGTWLVTSEDANMQDVEITVPDLPSVLGQLLPAPQ